MIIYEFDPKILSEWTENVESGMVPLSPKEPRMAKSPPVKPPSARQASIAGKALATGKATATQIKSMAGRIEAERQVSIPNKPKPKK